MYCTNRLARNSSKETTRYTTGTIAITNSMPILRTSVDHGTAFDIAGKGIASAVSMIESVKLAAKYAPFFTRMNE